ncbi:MAG: DUF2971 domain-containing protein [Planctomycetes bacterium]|nr:DUF2971 domain-containing protein [Planctomycetota bacterium]
MNILYKYCDQLGIVKILGSLELKLPYISQVNDPLECLPVFYCLNDKSAMEAKCLCTFKRNNINPPVNWKHKLYEQFEKGEIQEKLKEGQREVHKDWNQRKGCLLSVSKTAKEPVMWAHYAEIHKGAAIGIDFDNVFPNTHKKLGIVMDPVKYSKKRPKVNVLEESEGSVSIKALKTTLMTKSDAWSYEEEFRTVFMDTYLRDLEQQGLARLKDFNGKKTWFLRLAPKSIRKIIFGLYTEEGLKLAIKNLVERAELQHVKLYQTEESETYTLNLVGL